MCGFLRPRLPASAVLQGRRDSRGPFLRASRGSQVGTVATRRPADRCEEVVPGHPRWPPGLCRGLAAAWPAARAPGNLCLPPSESQPCPWPAVPLKHKNPPDLLLPLTSESASIFLTDALALLSFSPSPAGHSCHPASSFLQGPELGLGRGLAWWVPGEDLPFSCYTDLIPVERTLRIAQLLFFCPAVCRRE